MPMSTFAMTATSASIVGMAVTLVGDARRRRRRRLSRPSAPLRASDAISRDLGTTKTSGERG